MSKEPNHDRGTFTHPGDGKTYKHPSSLESAHHVDHEGNVVYSPAQKEAIARLKGQSPPQEQTESPNFTNHESPALREPEHIVIEESTTDEASHPTQEGQSAEAARISEALDPTSTP